MYNQLKAFHVRYTHFLQPAWRVQSGILPRDHTCKQINTFNVKCYLHAFDIFYS